MLIFSEYVSFNKELVAIQKILLNSPKGAWYDNNKEIDKLCELYGKYIQEIENKDILENNIKSIKNYIEHDEKSRQIKPLLFFLIFVRYQSKIHDKDDNFETNNLLETYKKYDGDSRSSDTYEKYIQLFCELLTLYKEDITINVDLCLYAFHRTNNLYDLLYDNAFDLQKKITYAKNFEESAVAYGYNLLAKIGLTYDFYIFLEQNELPFSLYDELINTFDDLENLAEEDIDVTFDTDKSLEIWLKRENKNIYKFINKHLSDQSVGDYVQFVFQENLTHLKALEKLKQKIIALEDFPYKDISKDKLLIFTETLDTELDRLITHYIRYDIAVSLYEIINDID